MAVDGTFLKAQVVQKLLLTVGIDANRKSLILAWTVVESENKELWAWFFSHLKHAIPQSLIIALISDQDKGFLAADDVSADVNCLVFCFHLKSNFRKHYQALEQHFWSIVNAQIEHNYAVQIEALQTLN